MSRPIWSKCLYMLDSSINFQRLSSSPVTTNTPICPLINIQTGQTGLSFMFWCLHLQTVEIAPSRFERQMSCICKHVSRVLYTALSMTPCLPDIPTFYFHIKKLRLSCLPPLTHCHILFPTICQVQVPTACSRTCSSPPLPLCSCGLPVPFPPVPANPVHSPPPNSHALPRSSSPFLLLLCLLPSPFLNTCLPTFVNINLDLGLPSCIYSSTHMP